MTAKNGTASTSTYALNGNTLVDINKDMQSKGPRTSMVPAGSTGLAGARLSWPLAETQGTLFLKPPRTAPQLR